MKIGVVVGTRPEIVKMAPVIRATLASGADLLLYHTGQHYSFALDGVFFEELELPAPHANLAIGSGTQAYQVGAVITGLTPLLERDRPDVVLVEGDTNSVLAAGLAAHKLGIRVGHVEAGLRSGDRTMPEEINRLLADQFSDFLYAPTPAAGATLLREGRAAESVLVTGNTVVDELLRQRPRACRAGLLEQFAVEPGKYGLATVHRAENTNDPARLAGIVAGLSAAADALGLVVLCALHPRTRQRMTELGLAFGPRVRALEPLGYLDFLGLHAQAALTLTDSGGLQEEACCLGVPCVTLRDNTERPESVEAGANLLAGAAPDQIVAAAREMRGRAGRWTNPFGDGRAGERIIQHLLGLAD